MENFEAALATFLKLGNEMMEKSINAQMPAQYRKVLEAQSGSRYVRIVCREPAISISGYAWCFIDKTTGDVLKPAGWKGPAKNFSRGNIFDDNNGLGRFRWTGIK